MKVEQEVVEAVQKLHACGVVHTDVRDLNVLWNGETGRVTVIDFEQAVLAEQLRPALAAIAPNKRWRIEDVDDGTNRKVKNDVFLGMWREGARIDISESSLPAYAVAVSTLI